MSIQGTPGVTVGETKSATYGPTQYREFINDAEELGLTTDFTNGLESKAWAYDAKGLITGEWSSKTGGQLAWS
jgi:hypothetical protein